ncbi:MAG: DUF1080 domain-containing protein [Fimbriimonadaceae bacterium]|nr:DUF1080 domain-containing protein [Fimbriimonadaceae bacterium]
MTTALFAFLACASQAHNALTEAERAAGWELLFDGRSTQGWHGYNKEKVGEGWKVEDGELRIAEPRTAGDIVTDKMFEWFELSLEANLDPGQNSGILVRVADGSKAAWHSGPEIQLYDHAPEAGVEITGYLYQLYTTDHPAAKPAGEWNLIRVLWSKEKCATWVNGEKYYEFVYQSEDFLARVAKSKFTEYPEFAKATKGRIGLQGDHGRVAFRNLKIRPILD